jgi:recombinational DNA repair ATPase RecF
MMLRYSSGEMFLKSSPSVLSIDEPVILFRVSNYYTSVRELNNLLTSWSQSQQPPVLWDRRIEEVGNAVSFDRLQLRYEVQQVIARLTGKGATE